MTTTAHDPTAPTADQVDPDAVEAFAGQVFGYYTGGMLTFMIDIGQRTGLFAALAGGPATSDELASRMDTVLTFGTAGIRGVVGAGPGRMNRAVVIRTTFGLARYLGDVDRPVVVAYLLVVVFLFIMINLTVDLLYSILDPRVRLADVKH